MLQQTVTDIPSEKAGSWLEGFNFVPVSEARV